MSLEDEVTGNPIGIGSNMTFSGSGELDNGTTFALSIAHANKAAYSNTNIVITVPSLGDIRIDQGVSGTGIDRMDDLIPTAWEEAYGAGLGTGIVTVDGSAGGSNIEWTPTADMLPDGLSARVAYSPKVNGSGSSDKTVSADDGSGVGSGWDVTLTHTALADGLTLYGGYSTTERADGTYQGDAHEHTYGVTYAQGNVTVGYQYSKDNVQEKTGTSYYENNGIGISFLVNDDLSLSYGRYESERVQDKPNSTNVTTEATSIQLAYTMGGASIRLAENSVDDGNYTSGTTKDRDGTTLSLSLAF